MTNFKAYSFDGKGTAREVLDVIEDSQVTYLWEEDVALISVNKRGHVRVYSTWAQDSSNVPGGVALGAITGGLVGLLFGPGGALAGIAAGGSMGGLIGHHENVKWDDPALADFATSLVKDSSALVLLGDESAIGEFAAAVANYDGDAAEYDALLDDAAMAEIKDELNLD